MTRWSKTPAVVLLLVAATIASLVIVVLPAAPAGAACAPPSSKQLGGTLVGEDGRFVSALVGIEIFDANRRSIGLDGCVRAAGSSYSHIDLLNESGTTGCCFLLDHEGTTQAGYESTWDATRYRGPLPANAAYAWIEVYPKSRTAGEKGHATSYARYGGIMRRFVALGGNVDLRLPLGCGLGPVGDNGTIEGRVVRNGVAVAVTRVAAWSRAADQGTGPMGFGVQGGGSNGMFSFVQAAPNQTYGLHLTTSVGSFWVENSYDAGIAVHPCATTRVTIDVGHNPPRVRPSNGGDGVGTWAGRDLALTDALTSGSPSRNLAFGQAGDRLVYGDWDRDGTDTPGVRRGSRFILSNDPAGKTPFITFDYGTATDVPVVGDWDGDGYDTIGVRRGDSFILRNANSYGAPHHRFSYGAASDQPLIGDWDGNGTDTPGVRRGDTFILRNANSYGAPHHRFPFGTSADAPIAGDWDGR